MATLTITTTYADGDILYAADFTDIISAVEGFLNTTKLAADNIQDEGVTVSSKVLDGSISTAKILNDAVTEAKIADNAVETSKILNDAVTADKLATDAVTTAKIGSSAVNTAAIANTTITKDKLSATNYTLSSSCGAYSVTNTSYTDVTNLSASITTTGRPVELMLVSDGSASNVSNMYVYSGSHSIVFNDPLLYIKVVRDSTDIAEYALDSGEIVNTQIAISDYPTIGKVYDTPGAGTYTYKIQAKYYGDPSSTTTSINYLKLFVREL